MQVAFHETEFNFLLLLHRDNRAKVQKTLPLNSYDIVHRYLTKP